MSCRQEVLEFFTRRLPDMAGFESRPQQLEMALAVAQAFEEDELLVVEAGTGTGKSLAYLVPALFWAQQSGQSVVVSTGTLTLQQQILDKDIPLLGRLLDFPFRAVLARGWSNYVCLRRLEGLVRAGGGLEPREQAVLVTLQEDLIAGKPGVRQKLSVPPALWDRVACDSTACGRQRCGWYAQCYLFRERRDLEGAALVVTNHALLLADLALRQAGAPGILPARDRLILDEAHHLEEIATEHLARGLGSGALHRLTSQLFVPRARAEEGGFLAALRQALARSRVPGRQELLATVDRHLLGALPSLGELAAELFAQVGELARDEKTPLTAAMMSSEAGAELRRRGLLLGQRLTDMAEGMREVRGRLQKFEDQDWHGLEVELAGFAERLAGMQADLEFCLFPEDPEWVYWLEKSARGRGLAAAPLQVGPHLEEGLLAPARTAVLTSATLAVQRDLNFFARRVGLSALDGRTRHLWLPSPFDFRQQALLGVATDLPDPSDPRFPHLLAGPVAHLAGRLGGATFLLVTSWALLQELEALLRPALEAVGVEVLAQGQEDRHLLLERFRSGGRYLLLGTDSFWEGVDVPGEALRCVILSRLPFRVPTEPVLAARAAQVDRQGRNAFQEYQLPLAVLKFRQGFGRLIRSQRDRGIVLVLDHRLVRRAYGQAFLESLPPCRRLKGPLQPLVEACLQWLETPSEALPADGEEEGKGH
ncbi:MAG TPA: helicase C-terminal domain-containing protein [Candidatus Nitrosotenuis sp.]|nr:helicase C-terminal domain-containing protein [Candidatus Nitrosotenuis sp.]